MSADPPFLTVGTEVSAKYKGAFCEAKIKKLQKVVRCKVAPKDGGPKISVNDDAINGELKMGALVKVKQPDSGQLVEGTIARIIDASAYTVVFDDGDIATLKRTQICLKGDKHFIESETLDQLPLTHPEHFGSPVNLIKKERRRRGATVGTHGSPSTVTTFSDESDLDDDILSRRSPRGAHTAPHSNLIGKVVSVEVGERKKWYPALVIKPANCESELKAKGLLMVKSFKDNKIATIHEKDIRAFTKDTVKQYSDDKLLKPAVDKALLFKNQQELPVSWKREALLGPEEPTPSQEVDSSGEDDPEDSSNLSLPVLTKMMDDRNTPISKPVLIATKEIDLSRLYKTVMKMGGFSHVCGQGAWKEVSSRLGLTAANAATEVKLFYKKFIQPYEEVQSKKSQESFERARASRLNRNPSASRLSSATKERDAITLPTGVEVKKTVSKEAVTKEAITKEAVTKEAITKEAVTKESSEKKVIASSKMKLDAAAVEDIVLRSPGRPTRRDATDREKRLTESPKRPDSPTRVGKGRPAGSKSVMSLKVKASKIDLDLPPEEEATQRCRSSLRGDEDIKIDEELASSEDESPTVLMEVDYPPGTKLRVRYGRMRNHKTYEAKVTEVKMDVNRMLQYCVHYSGWNVRYDEWVHGDRILGTIGKVEKKKIEILKMGYGLPRKKGRVSSGATQAANSASSTGSVTPEPAAVRPTIIKSPVSNSGTKAPLVPSQRGVSPPVLKPLLNSQRPSSPSTKSVSASSQSSEPVQASASLSTASTATAPVASISQTPSKHRTDVNLSRPTRSKSIDSELATGLPVRRRVRRNSIVDSEKAPDKQEDHNDDDSSSSEKGYEPAEGDKSHSSEDLLVDSQETLSGTKEVLNLLVTDVNGSEAACCEEMPASAADSDKVTVSDKDSTGDPPLQPESPQCEPPIVIVDPIAAVAMGTEGQDSSSPRPVKPKKGVADKGLRPVSDDRVQRVCATERPQRLGHVDPTMSISSDRTQRMGSAERIRMIDVIEKVAEGDLASSTGSEPAIKKRKCDWEETQMPTQMEGAFVKIEPLKHKKPQARRGSAKRKAASPTQQEETAPKEHMTEIICSESGMADGKRDSDSSHTPSEARLEQTTSSATCQDPVQQEDVNADHDLMETSTVDSERSSSEDVEPPKPAGASLPVLITESISAVSTVSEQENIHKNKIDTPSNRSARQQRIRRPTRKVNSSKFKLTGNETALDHMANAAILQDPNELILSNSTDNVSPLKSHKPRGLKTRPSKFNFRIEEGLALIEDQDDRINYLVDKMQEIRRLYANVKSDLASIERRRKRSRRWTRDVPSQDTQSP